MTNNTIRHKDIVAKIAKQMNLPEELVHTVALAYLDTILTIATTQGQLFIENMFSISVSPKKINQNSLNNLRNQQHKSTIDNPQSTFPNPQSAIEQSKISIKVKFHPSVVQNVLDLYEKSFSPESVNQIVASISDTLNSDLQQIKNQNLSPTTTNPKSKITNPKSTITNPQSQDLQTSSFKHILTLDQIAKKS